MVLLSLDMNVRQGLDSNRFPPQFMASHILTCCFFEILTLLFSLDGDYFDNPKILFDRHLKLLYVTFT